MRTAKFTKTLSLALNSDMFDQLKHMSDQENVSMAEIVREIIIDALNWKNGVHDLNDMITEKKYEKYRLKDPVEKPKGSRREAR